MKATAFYTLAIVITLAGYSWLGLHYIVGVEEMNSRASICVIKSVSGYPCPSCGSTRAVTSLAGGQIVRAFQWNPFGFIIVLVLLILPPWLIADGFRKSTSLYLVYQKSESYLRKRAVFIPLIIITLLNWAWNIYKGL